MEEPLYREKSLERISSPEKLDDYIRVTTPRIWIILAAILVLLMGVIIWGIYGSVEVTTSDGQIRQVAPITFVTN